jgi:HK97 family phage major capsid protein
MKKWIKNDKFVELSDDEFKELSVEEMAEYTTAKNDAKLKALKSEIKELTDNLNSEKISKEDFNTKLKAWESKLEDFDSDKFKAYQKNIEKLEEKVEAMGEKLNKASENNYGEKKSMNKSISDTIKENTEAIEGFAKNTGKAVSMTMKGVVNITDDTTGESYITNVTNRIVDAPEIERYNIRNLLTIQSTDMPQIAFMVVYDWSDNTGMVSENGELPESAFKEKEEIFSTKRLGTFINISKNMLKSMKQLIQHISQKLPARLKYVEDNQLLFGDGTGNNVNGIFNDSLDFKDTVTPVVRAAGDVASVATANAGASIALTLTTPITAGDVNVGDYVYITGATETSYNGTLIPVEVVTSTTVLQLGVTYVAEADTSGWTFTVVAAKYSGIFMGTDSAQFVDVLLDASAIVNEQEYKNTGFVLHPLDASKILKYKDTTDNYLSNGAIVNIQRNAAGVLFIGGVPVIETTAMTQGKFACGDWALAAALWIYEDMELVFSEDNESIRKNQVQVSIQEQIIFPIYNHLMFVTGDFTEAITTIDDGN